jgi:ApbE superfamily uncharacterized protein (UPF0280 family)
MKKNKSKNKTKNVTEKVIRKHRAKLYTVLHASPTFFLKKNIFILSNYTLSTSPTPQYFSSESFRL